MCIGVRKIVYGQDMPGWLHERPTAQAPVQDPEEIELADEFHTCP